MTNAAAQAPLEGRSLFSPAFVAWQAGVHLRFLTNATPEHTTMTPIQGSACKNESLPFQLAAARADGGRQLRVVCSELNSGPATVPSGAWKVHFVDYVNTLERGEVADILSDDVVRPLRPSHIQPIWLTLHIPRDTPEGVYTGTVSVWCDEASINFPVKIEVLARELPDTRQGAFYLDLWQHPAAIARYHHVRLWSEPHWALLRAYTRMLADAGQNPITACIIFDPWASQTFDPHETMVDWRKEPDGSLSFDFSVFDRYVEMCFEEGFTGPINCYSMAMGPGLRMDCPVRYWDVAHRRYGRLECIVGDAAYGEAWQQFFAAFVPHLEAKGWSEKTSIAMDEAPEDKMEAMFKVIPKALHIALAGNYHEHLDSRIQDYSVIYPGAPNEVNAARRARGQTTTFYTCTGPAFPNTFCFSPPIESRLLAWNALQKQADGYLRWAFASWPEDPLRSAVFAPWQSGDTFLVYPGPRSSIRFEMLKKGIQDFEAYQLAARLAPQDPRLTDAINRANGIHDGTKFIPGELETARNLVNDVLRGPG
ncbi:MAG: DUF4091 domain-containing protein [Candidatus Hydrogenedentes bacterium]|nr:DUF4091 domain-containing protein [Candidatus Hydrogenedentota bacterium]